MNDECQEWQGKRNADGYGVARYQGKGIGAHRFVWIQAHGPIPDGLHVLHSCDNPPCVNLDHLRLGTNAENQADKIAKGRANWQVFDPRRSRDR